MRRTAAVIWLLCAILNKVRADSGSPLDRVRNAAALTGAPDNDCRTASITFNVSVGSPSYLLSNIPDALSPLLVGAGGMLRRALSVNRQADGQDWDYAVYHADFGCIDLGKSTGLPFVMSSASIPNPPNPLQFDFNSTLHPPKIDIQHREKHRQDNLGQCITFKWEIGQPPKVAHHVSENTDGFVNYTELIGATPALNPKFLSQLFETYASGGDAAEFSRDVFPTIVGPLFTNGVLRYGNIPTPSNYSYQVPTFLTCALASADAQAETAFRSVVASVNNSWYKVVTAVWPNVLTMALAAWLAIDSFKKALSERAARWERWDRNSRLHLKVSLLGNLRRLFFQLVILIGMGLTVLIVQCTRERSGLLADWGAVYGLTVTYDTSNGSRWEPLSQDPSNPFSDAAYIVSPWVVVYKLQDPGGKLGLGVVYGAVATTGILWVGAVLYLNWLQQSDIFRSMSEGHRASKTQSLSPVLWILRYWQWRWAVRQKTCAITEERFGRALFMELMDLDICSEIDSRFRMEQLKAADGVFNRFKTREELNVADPALRKEMSAVLNGTKNPTDDIVLRVLCNSHRARRG